MASEMPYRLRVTDNFYGLFINGELKNVIRWNDERKPPCLFDFGAHISSVNDYAISPVDIRVQR